MSSMFDLVFAQHSAAARRSSQRELDRFVAWVRTQPVGEQVVEALEVIEGAVQACGPLSFERYVVVCGAAAALAYVALSADGFEWLWSFFRDVPGLFQIEWSWSQEPVEVR